MPIGSNKFSVYSNVFSFSICFAILLMLQLANDMGVFVNSFFAIFGKYSYGIYLCHIFVVPFINTVLGEGFSEIGLAGQIGKYMSICAVSLAAAVCVEKISILRRDRRKSVGKKS